MKYINQRRYPHIPYPTNYDDPTDEYMHNGTIKTSGCGLCSACMVVDQLLDVDFPLRECLQLSFDTGANHRFGTDMKILGPAVAERFNLDISYSDDIREAMEEIRKGAKVIVNVGGNREGWEGVFCHVGHYMAVIAAGENDVTILDPSFRQSKFVKPLKRGQVTYNGYFLNCAPEILDMDASNRSPRYYIFKRK